MAVLRLSMYEQHYEGRSLTEFVFGNLLDLKSNVNGIKHLITLLNGTHVHYELKSPERYQRLTLCCDPERRLWSRASRKELLKNNLEKQLETLSRFRKAHKSQIELLIEKQAKSTWLQYKSRYWQRNES